MMAGMPMMQSRLIPIAEMTKENIFLKSESEMDGVVLVEIWTNVMMIECSWWESVTVKSGFIWGGVADLMLSMLGSSTAVRVFRCDSFQLVFTFPGLQKSSYVLQSWADPGSLSPSVYVMILSTVAINAVRINVWRKKTVLGFPSKTHAMNI